MSGDPSGCPAIPISSKLYSSNIHEFNISKEELICPN